MLVLTRGEVEELLDLEELVDAVAAALADVSAGRASMPPRVAAEGDAGGMLLAMAAGVPSLGALTAKLVTLFPGNAGGPLATHQALIAAFDPATGEPVALLDGTAITALRTAAASALSARLLAPPGARVVAVVGTGVQGRAHARALGASFAEVVTVGRSAVEEAVRGADVVCCCTHADRPVLRRAWLKPGAHVTSVGFNPAGRELDEATVRDAVVVVESREAALAPVPSGSNDLRGVAPEDVVELGELVAGTRTADRERLTVYKSVGVAAEDAAATALVLARARATGSGRVIELG